ncbi:MAG TPA: hypothetical protein PKD92_02055 [Novosphingobium sp.]|nr:hypothetical protein [Novosphingobium sp.]
MGKDTGAKSREERLAERLRDNLRRRKQQARAVAGGSGADAARQGSDNRP